MTRTVALMIVVVAIGGVVAIYVWSAINQLLKGQASVGQVVLIIAAVAVLAGLVYILQRLSTQSEDPS
jgi:uncharacterized membrane protein (UPF0182 family)